MMKHSASVILMLALVAGCARKQPQLSPAAFRAAVAGTDWELHELHQLQGALVPQGNGGRRATIRFEADTARVAGFSGCNRYFGSYTLDGAALRFGGIGMTKMACPQGMSLERMLASALEATRRYEIADGTLTLLSDAGPVAKFVRPSQ
jgi:heat shock protein HslJ